MDKKKNSLTFIITDSNIKILNDYKDNYGISKTWLMNKAIEGFVMANTEELNKFQESLSKFKSPVVK